MDVTWFLAQQEPTNLYAFFSSVMKHETNSFFLIFPPFTRKTLIYFFSRLVSWHLMIRSLRGFNPLYWYYPWIYPSQYPSCWLYFHPAGFCWQFSQERTRCSWNMSDNISCDHSQSGVVGGLFPTRTAPTSINLKHGCNFFHWEKMIMDDQNATKSNKSVGKMN
jgi:hypothetical protein